MILRIRALCLDIGSNSAVFERSLNTRTWKEFVQISWLDLRNHRLIGERGVIVTNLVNRLVASFSEPRSREIDPLMESLYSHEETYCSISIMVRLAIPRRGSS